MWSVILAAAESRAGMSPDSTVRVMSDGYIADYINTAIWQSSPKEVGASPYSFPDKPQ